MTTLTAFIASTVVVSVPDSGATGLLLGVGILSLGIAARLLKKRK